MIHGTNCGRKYPGFLAFVTGRSHFPLTADGTTRTLAWQAAMTALVFQSTDGNLLLTGEALSAANCLQRYATARLRNQHARQPQRPPTVTPTATQLQRQNRAVTARLAGTANRLPTAPVPLPDLARARRPS